MMSKPLFAAGLALFLSSCGGAPAAKDGNATAATSAASTTTAAGSFHAEDACATLPKEKVAQVTGLQVTGAELSRVTPAAQGTASFSQCTYSFAGGASLDFFARQSPIDDNTPDAIQRTKQAQTEMMGGKIVDVPGLGTAAFTVDKMHQLHVFIGGSRYIYFMSATPPAGKPIEEVELALARAVAG